MTKSLWFFLFFFSSILASQLDFRLAGFVPNSGLFRNIYGGFIPVYQAEFSCDLKRDDFQFWTNLSFLHKSGCSCPLNVKTDLDMVIPSIGLKYLFWVRDYFNVYLGAGFCYSWLKENNHMTVCNKVHHAGGIFKFGIQKQYRRLNVSLFADYLVQKFHVHRSVQPRKVNSNGLLLGIGIGVVF